MPKQGYEVQRTLALVGFEECQVRRLEQFHAAVPNAVLGARARNDGEQGRHVRRLE